MGICERSACLVPYAMFNSQGDLTTFICNRGVIRPCGNLAIESKIRIVLWNGLGSFAMVLISKVVLYVCTHFAQNDYQSSWPSKLSDRLATNEIEQDAFP
jgi:hypothetical protein